VVFVFFVTSLFYSDFHDFCTRDAFQRVESNGAKGSKRQICNFLVLLHGSLQFTYNNKVSH